jgi:hypothetical protein
MQPSLSFGTIDAEVIVVLLFPNRGDVLAFDLAVDEVLFDLVTDDDVERIGELIGLAADQPRLDFVDEMIEVFVVHVVKARIERFGAGFLQNRHEFLAPADQVLVETAVGLADGRSGKAFDVVVVHRLRLILELEAVPAFVEAGEDVAPPILDEVFGGKTGVELMVVVAERVSAHHEAPPAMS